MSKFRLLAASVAVMLFSVFVYAGGGADEALSKLMDGNKRFVSGKLAKKDLGDARRKELSKGQHPYAIVLTCADSRVSPELLFDAGLGEVFVIRVAGNVVDEIALGSIEYAAEHLHTPLLIVLGHSNCGAVGAAMEAEGEPEGNIGEIVKKILPAVEKAKGSGLKDKAEILDMAIQENVRNVQAEIIGRSHVLKHLSEAGELKIKGGEYYLDSGLVKLL